MAEVSAARDPVEQSSASSSASGRVLTTPDVTMIALSPSRCEPENVDWGPPVGAGATDAKPRHNWAVQLGEQGC